MKRSSQAIIALYLSLFFVLVLTGCDNISAQGPSNRPKVKETKISQLDGLQVDLIDAPPQIDVPVFVNIKVYFTQTVQDPQRIQTLYTAIFRLQRITHYSVSCQRDSGYRYRLTFSQGNTTLPGMVVAPTGCRLIVVAKGERYLPDEAFWSLFASTLGVSTEDVMTPPCLKRSSVFEPGPKNCKAM